MTTRNDGRSTDEDDVVDMFDMLAARVRVGEPIHVSSLLDDVQGRLHVALVIRLRRETGLPVHVVHS